MRITALVIVLCIGFLGWYSTPNPPPEADAKSKAPIPAPAESVTRSAGPKRVAVLEDPCPAVDRSREGGHAGDLPGVERR